MTIRSVSKKLFHNDDYLQLTELYRSFFSTHNIFQKENKEIIKYLQEQAKENELILAEEESKIVGALFLVLEGKNIDGTHQRWKFRHFAFQSEKAAEELLLEAEKRVQNNSSTAKIELTIAENEKGQKFYLNNGYKKEGVLKNHYRWGESCFVLGKSISKK